MQVLVAAQMKMASNAGSKKRPWEEHELSSLAKAIVKFPAGSQNREPFFWRGGGNTVYDRFFFFFVREKKRIRAVSALLGNPYQQLLVLCRF